jgi:hypothetical protein
MPGGRRYLHALEKLLDEHRQQRQESEERYDQAQRKLEHERLRGRAGLEAQQRYEYFALREKHGFRLGPAARAIVDDPRAFVLGAQGIVVRVVR